MQKIHVSEIFTTDTITVFNAISDHENFLSGGGLKCTLIKKGMNNINGIGAIRKVISKKITFEEEIIEFEPNMRYAYKIISTIPKKPFEHKKGWLDFHNINGITHVHWHSHFTIKIPLIGGLIGWFVKNQTAKIFQSRLKYIKNKL